MHNSLFTYPAFHNILHVFFLMELNLKPTIAWLKILDPISNGNRTAREPKKETAYLFLQQFFPGLVSKPLNS